MCGEKITDSIPRVTIEQILEVAALLSGSDSIYTFDQVRQHLHQRSVRRAPASREAMWTAARDALSDLQRLGYATIGVLPRKRSEVSCLRETPCKLTDRGYTLARLYLDNSERAFDELLITWMNEHPYFRILMTRLLRGPLYIPDITSIKQLNPSQAQGEHVAERVIVSCMTRLEAIGFEKSKREIFSQVVHERIEYLSAKFSLNDLDPKKRIDAIEDGVVIPSFLAAEELPFDTVTFQHLIKVSQNFFSASWTSSHPDFDGRIVFATCEFRPDILNEQVPVKQVVHHGRTFAQGNFEHALWQSYYHLAGTQGGYVDAYSLRALVCLGLGIQPRVFNLCLEDIIHAGQASSLVIYTELPFKPPPPGEDYVSIGNKRIGLIKISVPKENEHAAEIILRNSIRS
ncbi:MAG: hypothetical protein AB1611_08270 [bacterium]